MPDLANFGDSVHWGQGHHYATKFAVVVAQRLGVTLRMEAHSGATIGVDTTCDKVTDPEVPFACPTILDQVRNYGYDPGNAQVVLLTGGINDVTVQRLLLPTSTPDEVKRITRKFCYADMRELLAEVAARFRNAETTILVSSYFPVFSKESDFEEILGFLRGRLIQMPPATNARVRRSVLERIVDNTQAFWTESTASLEMAVRDVGDRRMKFVFVPFNDENAMFADKPWLWEVKFKGLTIKPEDPVAKQRKEACDIFHRMPWDRQACYIASAGHPNVAGAREYVDALMAAM